MLTNGQNVRADDAKGRSNEIWKGDQTCCIERVFSQLQIPLDIRFSLFHSNSLDDTQAKHTFPKLFNLQCQISQRSGTDLRGKRSWHSVYVANDTFVCRHGS